MKFKTHQLGVLTLLIAGASMPAFSQTASTGAMPVAVLDTAGQPVAGATVTVVSNQTQRSLVTGADGRVLFSLLNPGSWQVRAVKGDLSAPAQSVSLSVNETRPVVIHVAATSSTTVEVVSSSTAVDPTSTTTGATLSLDDISAVPKGRDVSQLIFLSPGVSSGGFGTNGLDTSINGASGAENSWSIDGLSSTDYRYGGRGTTLPTDFIDQVDIQTGGYKPEYSALGGVFNVVTKSGSNGFRGSVSTSTTPTGLEPGPKRTVFTQEATQSGGTDIAAWVGGSIVKDKLFYSVGAYGNFTQAPGETNFSGVKSDDTKSTQSQYFLKLQWLLTQDQQLTFNLTHNGNRTQQDHAAPSAFGNGEVGATVDYNTNGASIGYNWNITPTLYLDAKLGQSRIINNTDPTDKNDPVIFDRHWFQGATANQAVPGAGAGTLPSYLTDTTTIYQRGGYGLYSREYNIAKQGAVNLTWVVGNHSLKFGFSDIESTYQLWERVSGDHRFTMDHDGGRLRDRVISNDAQVKAVYRAYYLQDTWQIGSSFNLFYGARAEDQDQINGAGKKFLSFKASDYVQPRIGFTWDPEGKGKSKLYGSYAIYYEAIPQRLAIREFTSEYFVESRYYSATYGATHNGNYVYSASPITSPGTYNAGTPDKVVDYGASFQNPPVESGIKLPRRKEYQLGYERTFDSGWTAGATLQYRKLENVIEDSVFVDAAGADLKDRNGISDGAEPAVLWNPGSTLKYTNAGVTYDFTGIDTLYPKAYNRYRALTLTLEKKTDRYFFSANYVLSRLDGNYQGLVSSSNGQPDANITASFDYWPYVGTGLLPLDHTHTLKLYGSYRFDVASHALVLGANFFAQTGNPISHFDDGTATFGSSANDFGGYGNDTPYGLKLGQFGRRPTTTKLDLHAEMEFRFSPTLALSPFIDVFNAYNSRPVTATVEQATDSGGAVQPAGFLDSATAWQTGRNFRFGAKLRF